MSGAAYVQTSMADIPIVKAECRQKKESKNLSAILSMPDHPDVKRLNVVVNANAKTPYLAFLQTMRKKAADSRLYCQQPFCGQAWFRYFCFIL